MRVYLDNCCYNRPYDDQAQIRISLESQAKLQIQEMITQGDLELVASFMLTYENSRNRSEEKRESIRTFIEDNARIVIDGSRTEEIRAMARNIEKTGVKPADAIHTACAILAECDYFLTTDDRLLRYESEDIKITNPIEFVRMLDTENNSE